MNEKNGSCGIDQDPIAVKHYRLSPEGCSIPILSVS